MSKLKRRTLSSIGNLYLDEETDNKTVCYPENNFPDESVNLSSDELSPDSNESFCLGQLNMTVWISLNWFTHRINKQQLCRPIRCRHYQWHLSLILVLKLLVLYTALYNGAGKLQSQNKMNITTVHNSIRNKKAVLPQGNRAMPQVFFSVEVRQQHSLQV